jgi:acyl-CoA thioester hydrolase
MTAKAPRAARAGSGRRTGAGESPIRFWVPVEVRYSDLDAQGHVNNATFFTYFEQSRVAYFAELRAHYREQSRDVSECTAAGEIRTETSAPDLPFVIANASCTYRRPIAALVPVMVGVRCSRITHASIEMEYTVADRPGGLVYATGSTLTVSIDPTTGRPRALPAWTRPALELLA